MNKQIIPILQAENSQLRAALHGAMVIIDTIPWPQNMPEKQEKTLVKHREAIIAAIAKATMTAPAEERTQASRDDG